MKKLIVIKVGTKVLTLDSGLPNLNRIQNLVNQIYELRKAGNNVILVSSGAVSSGKSVYSLHAHGECVIDKQLLASIGQPELMYLYKNFFSSRQILCGQILVTKEDFRDRNHYLNIKKTFETLLLNDVLPIVNENDVISIKKFGFTDNDELGGFISAMLNADKFIILTNVDGIYTGNPNDPESKLINEVNEANFDSIENYIADVKSAGGTGGMVTKIKIAKKLANIGIETIMANGNADDIAVKIIEGKSSGTQFKVRQNVSSFKKWIAYNQGFEKGSLIINKGAEEILTSKDKAASLLPVGIINVKGEFEKGDIVSVENEINEKIATGIASMGSSEIESVLGLKDQKEAIHYDYLFVH